MSRPDKPGFARPGGWIMTEILFAVVAVIALAGLGWMAAGDIAQRGENRQKATVAIWEVSAFAARAETGVRDIPNVIQDGQGFDLPGDQFAGRGGACRLDSGDAGFAGETAAYQGVVRTCVPCSDSGGGWVPVASLGAIACTTGSGLPKRCPTQASRRAALPLEPGSLRATAPTNTQLMQGIWIPADSLQDAIEIQHLIESHPQFSRLPDMAISRTGDPADASVTAGVLLCV